MTGWMVKAAVAAAVLYSVVHVVMSGVIFPLRTPNVGQVVEELQPLYRLFTSGAATVDHPRQYGPVFLFLLHPVYRLDLVDRTLLGYYSYLLGVLAVGAGFFATVLAIRTWAASRGATVSRAMLLALALLWANFSPLYGVLAVKNVELWELALISIAIAAMLRGRRWLTAWSIAAAALVKMLPLVFVPYLLLRDRKTLAYTLVALAAILTASQIAYGTAMGWGYLPAILQAAAGGDGYGNALGMTWHENVSLRGVVLKAFGRLEKPDFTIVNPEYSRGFYVLVDPALRPVARAVGLAAEVVGMAWVAWILFRRRHLPEPSRACWDMALIALMMLVLAPQASHDYMVLTLPAFSFVLAACRLYGSRAAWIEFAIAVLLVANIVPRGLFSRAVMIDPIMRLTGYEHLTRAEAYQYFGFPLLGLLVLARAWSRLSAEDVAHHELADEPTTS